MSEEVTAPESVEEQPVNTGAEQASEAPVNTEAEPTEAGEGEIQYAPNLSYNVRGEEKQFDEWLAPVITSKEQEDAIRDLYTKANGLDILKSSFEERQTQYDEVSGKYNTIQENIKVLQDYVSNNDYGKFFESLNIPKEAVQKWMLSELNYQQMDPEQKQAYDQHWNTVRTNAELARENEQLSTQFQEFQVQQRENELNQILTTPEVNATMQAFDQRMGRVGAFRDEVVRRAQAEAQLTGNDIPAQDAVNQLMQLIGFNGNGAGTPPAQPQAVAPEQKPVIPNIQGRGTSPVRKVPKSIDDMRAMYDEKYGND